MIAVRRLWLAFATIAVFAIGAVLALILFTPAPPVPPAIPTPLATNPGHVAVQERYNPSDSLAQAERFFDRVAAPVAATGAMDSAAYVNAFRAAGVPNDVMELTDPDGTVGIPQETVQFSIRYGDTCIIGDVGHGTFTSTVMPATYYETCLIGGTRPIDF